MISKIYDIAIIGAGIVGLSTAWELLKHDPHLKLALVEKEDSVAEHQSGRNSGVIHSGIYYKPGSQKAVNCIRGYARLLTFCDAYDVQYQICGKFIVAKEQDEIKVLREILRRGTENGLQGLDIIDSETVQREEPLIRAAEAVYVPQAGIIDFGEVCRKLQALLTGKGVVLYTGHEVQEVRREEPGQVTVLTAKGPVHARFLINCAGLYADKVAQMTGMEGDFRIVPFRGEFYRLDSSMDNTIRHHIYPVPDLEFPFLGVHFTRQLDGSIEAGPNAVLAFRREGYRFWQAHPGELLDTLGYSGFIAMARRHWRKGLDEVWRSFSPRAFHVELKKLIPSLKFEHIERARSGVRAQCVATDGTLIYDYLFLEDEQIINVCNAPSPAATSCFAIGEDIAQKVMAKLR